MIHVKDLELFFGKQAIFDQISFNLDELSRVGLVGRNGSGKSTLLKVIAKQEPFDAGVVTTLTGKRIAYMPQDVVLMSQKTILQEAMQAFGDITKLLEERDELERALADGDTDEPIINRYIVVQDKLALIDPTQLAIEAERILLGLGFKREQLEQPVSSLSVGWKMRIVLAQLLLQKADFYLFDEPTNHLDIVAKDWFLQFLKHAPFGFMLVCHERYFLDQLCTSILALEMGNARVYKGNYSAYIEQYERDKEQLETAFALQQKDIQRRKDTIARFKAKANKASMAKSMQKQLENIDLIELPPSPKNIRFNFPEPTRSGRIVLEVAGVSHTFGDKNLFNGVKLHIERGERIALVAANGVGKTTLFNIIVGNIPLQKGNVTFGSNVEHTIFAQDQHEALDLDRNIIDNAFDRCSKRTEQEIRGLLGAFLFDGETIKKKIRVLSGGEKNRVAMAIVLLQRANFLLLDEPTNHLDMPSKEVLIKALNSYTGTILFVSHDHHFINELATRVIELTPHGAYAYEGNYDAYLHQKQEIERNKQEQPAEQPRKAAPAPAPKEAPGKQSDAQELKRIENDILKVERELQRLEASFAELTYGTPAFDKATEQLTATKKRHEQLLQAWETAA
jgi:ATP-binding cassette subfamily F protein 3